VATTVYRKDEVFNVSPDVPLNYVARHSADDLFVQSLTRDKHIVLHGSSKQGKTTLRKVCLKPDDCIVIHCSAEWSKLADLHQQILKEAGFEVTSGTTTTGTGIRRAHVSLSAGSVSAQAGTEYTASVSRGFTPLEIDLNDVNDVIRALRSISFERFVVLEDFHYLPVSTQQSFSTALKAFHENSRIRYIIVGVWKERNRLVLYNGDLSGRVVSVNVDTWSPDELRKVISQGERLLNIAIDEKFVSGLISAARESVYIVQEACNRLCEAVGIYNTQPELTGVRTDRPPQLVVQEIVDEDAARYLGFLTRFADGFRASDLEMYRWILYPVLRAPIGDLEAGLRYNEMFEAIEGARPTSSMQRSDLSLSLEKVTRLQLFRGVRPIVLDYDSTSNRLSVVDRSFLIWLAHQDRENLLGQLGLPTIL
jgi:hypothetical protein